MFLKDNYSQINEKPDIKLKMDIKTFNDLSEKKICGAYAFLTGKVKVEGSIFTLQNFESNVVCKYFKDKY